MKGKMLMCFKGKVSNVSDYSVKRGKVLVEPVVECRGSSQAKKYNINDPDCPQHMKDCWKRLTGKDGM